LPAHALAASTDIMTRIEEWLRMSRPHSKSLATPARPRSWAGWHDPCCAGGHDDHRRH
jgi:hypothetical protein